MKIMQEKYPTFSGYLDIKSLIARFKESHDESFLVAIVCWLNSCKGVKKFEDAGGRDVASLANGGSASASSQSFDYKPENAFQSGDDSWWSNSNKNEFIERNMTSAATPFIFAMQIYEPNLAPLKFKVIGRGEAEGETLLEVDDVAWEKDDQWKFWALEKKANVKAFRVVVEKYATSFVALRNIRLYC